MMTHSTSSMTHSTSSMTHSASLCDNIVDIPLPGKTKRRFWTKYRLFFACGTPSAHFPPTSLQVVCECVCVCVCDGVCSSVWFHLFFVDDSKHDDPYNEHDKDCPSHNDAGKGAFLCLCHGRLFWALHLIIYRVRAGHFRYFFHY